MLDCIFVGLAGYCLKLARAQPTTLLVVRQEGCSARAGCGTCLGVMMPGLGC